MYPIGRMENIVVQKMEDEVLVYDTKLNKALCLNETSAMVWDMCDGKTSSVAIAKKVSEKIGEPVSEEFVWLAMDRLKKENLLLNGSEIHSKFGGMSRREVIKNIGFTSMVALPLISSIVAPEALNAQSLDCSTAPFPAECAFTICITGAVPAEPICNNSCNNVAGNCANGTATSMNCVPASGNPANQQCDCVCT